MASDHQGETWHCGKQLSGVIHVMRLCEGLSLCSERHGKKSFDTQKCAAQWRRRCVANSAAASWFGGGKKGLVEEESCGRHCREREWFRRLERVLGKEAVGRRSLHPDSLKCNSARRHAALQDHQCLWQPSLVLWIGSYLCLCNRILGFLWLFTMKGILHGARH